MTEKALHAAAALLSLALLAAFTLPLTGCGHHHHDPIGFMLVDNRTDLTTNEFVSEFRVAAFQQPYTGNLLAGDLLPGDALNLGAWTADYYDAEALLELGQVSEWFDVLVAHGDTAIFEVR